MDTIVKKVSYHLQVYEIIKKKIITGELARGQKISEYSLAQTMDVSRSPVREALRMLEQDELLVSGSDGLRVNPLTIEDVKEIYETRMVLESYSARRGCRLLSEEEINRLQGLVEFSKQNHQAGRYDEVIASNTKFHDIIISSCPNSHLKKMIEKNRSLYYVTRTHEFSSYRRDAGYLDEHMEIVDVLRKRDEDSAERMMREHIRRDLDFYIKRYGQEDL